MEASKRHGSGWRRVIGQAAYVHRIMVALDYVGQLGARDAMLLYAANARNDLEAIAAAERRFDKAETDRARAQARAEMGPKAKKVDVQAREREILEDSSRSKVRWSGPYLPTPEPAGNMLFGGSRNAIEMMRAPSARALPVRR